MDQVPGSPDGPREPQQHRPPGPDAGTGPGAGTAGAPRGRPPAGTGHPARDAAWRSSGTPGASGAGGDVPPQPPGPASCYRHPGRETGIRCTRCERPICTDCMVNASVGYQCPECARATAHTARATRPRTLAGGPLASSYGLVTKILIAVNAVVFIAVSVNPALLDRLLLVGVGVDGSGQVIGVDQGEWWRLLTAVFTHQELLHIALNMLSLWWIGPAVENALGRMRFLGLYLLAGLGGSALSYLLAPHTQYSLGASGAIFGLMGALAVLVRRVGQDMRPVLVLLAVNLAITWVVPNIAWQAHVGGLVVGVAVAYGMAHAPRAHRDLVQAGTCAVALLAVVAVVWLRYSGLVG